MTWYRRLYPVGDPVLLRPAYGNIVGPPPQLADSSDASFITLTYLDGSGSTVIETQVDSLDLYPETVGATVEDIRTVHRVSWSGPPATFDGEVPILSVGPPSMAGPIVAALPGWSYPPAIPNTIYTLGPNSGVGILLPIAETILRDPDPWVRLLPEGLLAGGIGDYMTYYEFWIEVSFAGPAPGRSIPERRIFPRQATDRQIWPPPATRQAGRGIGPNSPV